jgi:hypothetical protein
MKPRFLLDENLSPSIVLEVRRHNLAIDIVHVGDSDAPPLNTRDPDILVFCERGQRILVTKNRKSMPGHLTDHIQAGRTFCGMLSVKRGREGDIGGIVESLILVWELQEAEEYVGVRDWIPF